MIKVKNLVKRFGNILAVDNIAFEVNKGEVLGFLGPNGAGKSTTMKMLTCYLSPDAGTATIDGHDIISNSKEVKEIIGYVPENVPSYDDMTVYNFLRFVCDTRGIFKKDATKAIERVIEQISIGSVIYQSIATLSKGFKRRVGLAQALLHDPKILILDEPTDGLDPNQKHDVRNMIKKMGRDKCIIISTHILEEVEAVCTRAIIIAKGAVLADGTPAELTARGNGKLDEYFRKITTQNTVGSKK